MTDSVCGEEVVTRVERAIRKASGTNTGGATNKVQFIARAVIQAHTAALREAGLLREWLPIESAPKDGTSVLLWLDSYCEVAHWHTANASGGGISGWAPHAYWRRPTHWMSLPAAPPYPPDTEGKI